MAAGLILQFPGVGEQDYDAVNAQLRFNPRTGEGDWPAGLQSHSAGATGDGWVVTEIWESKDAQAEFMHSSLGPALAGMPNPTVTWFDVVASQHRH
ncbi:MAG TPA: hypothetical protein VN840_06480 [Streptosporangiaceae bacterium]|nr:hypothetical protein [Streptosporangiaceae bacterium]